MKLKIYILVIICIISAGGNAQEAVKTKKVTKQTYGTTEKFEVLKSDKSIRHGTYQRIAWNGICEKGQYRNGEKCGIWIYYNNGSVQIKYDFDSDSLLYLSFDKLDTEDVDRPVFYFGSLDVIMSYIARNMRYPEQAAQNGESGRVLVTIHVDESGQVFDYSIRQSVSFALDKEAIRVAKSLPFSWVPAQNEGKNVQGTITFPMNFVLQ
jgi:TonB family protein